MTVIIGVDPHQSTHTVVAIDRDERPLARLQLVATSARRDWVPRSPPNSANEDYGQRHFLMVDPNRLVLNVMTII